MQGLRVVLELPEVKHVDGQVRKRLLRCSKGLKGSSYSLSILAYGHLKVVVYNFEGVSHFG